MDAIIATHKNVWQLNMSDWIYRLTKWVLGGIFIYAGGIKLFEPTTFAVLVEAYGIIPENMLMLMAVLLPALEVIAGIGLLFDIRGSLSAIALLLLLFIAVMGYGIWMGLDVDCGCFGPEDPEAEAFHGLRLSLYRDLIMCAGVVYIYVWRRLHDFNPLRIKRIFNQLRR